MERKACQIEWKADAATGAIEGYGAVFGNVDSYGDIIDACCEAWNKFTKIPNAIRSLCTRNWANLAPVHGMS